VRHLRASFDDLKAFQEKGSGGYLKNMRQNLIDIAFFLAPAVDELISKWVAAEDVKYKEEHADNDVFYAEIVEAEKARFEQLYQEWKEGVVRFHLLKQEEAI